MRTARTARRAGLRAAAGLAALAAVMLVAPAPAQAEGVFVEVNPSTIQAGFQVAIRASCGDALNPAKVTSEAFGEVTVQPVNAYLIAAVTVPGNTKARQYSVRLTCPSKQTATSTLWVIGQETPTKGPATGGGGMADNGTMMISGGAAALGLGAALMLARRHRRTGA
jgi:hypothetical protein